MLYTFSSITVLLFTLYLLVSSPAFQTLLARSMAKRISAELGTDVNIDKVKIRFFRSVVLKGLMVKDLNKDTLMYSGSLQLYVSDFRPGSKKLAFSEVRLHDTNFSLRKYKGDENLNLDFIIRYFSGEPSAESTNSGWKISVSRILLKNCDFRMEDFNRAHKLSGIDYNYLVFSNINLDINQFNISGDTLSGNIRTFSVREKSGFVLDDFRGEAKFSPTGLAVNRLIIKTKHSDLDLDLEFRYRDFSGFTDFIDSVSVKADIRESRLNLKDIGFFAPELSLSDEEIVISTQVKGLVSGFMAKNLDISYGMQTRIRGNISFTGLPDFYNTYINATFTELRTHYDELSGFNLPPGGDTLTLPTILQKLGNVMMKGKFTGFPEDFQARFDVESLAGDARFDLSMKNKGDWMMAEYEGTLECEKLLPDLLLDGTTGIGEISFKSRLNGRGLNAANASLSTNTSVSHVIFRERELTSMVVEGTMKDQIFNGFASVHDHKLDFEVKGLVDLSNQLPRFDVDGQVKLADLHYFGLGGLDSATVFSGKFEIDLLGNDPDNIQGMIKGQDITFIERKGGFRISTLSLVSTQDSSHYRMISLYSDVIEGSMQGNFSIADLPGYFSGSINRYSNNFIADSTIIVKDDLNQDFVFEFKARNINPILEVFLPGIYLAPNTEVNGDYNFEHQRINLNFMTTEALIAGIKVKDLNVKAGSDVSHLKLDALSSGIFMNDTLSFDNFKLNADLANDTITYKMAWQNVERRINNLGIIAGKLWFRGVKNFDMNITDGNFFIKDNLWSLEKNNILSIDSSEIKISNYRFSSKDEILEVNGVISDDEDQSLKIKFSNFDVSNFDDITSAWLLDFNGTINGNLTLNNLYHQPGFTTNLQIDEFAFNNEKLGDVECYTHWDDMKRALEIKTDITYTGNISSKKVLFLEGNIYPFNQAKTFDIDIGLDNYKLFTFAPYLSDFSSDLSGMASGKLHLGGSSQKPELTGVLSLVNTGLRIDYLNTSYSFGEKVYLTPDKIYMENAVLYDTAGKKAITDLVITHKYLRDFRLDLTLKPQNFSCLNTQGSQNPLFYGSGVASGIVKIHGPFNDLNIDIDASTEKGTELFIPINLAQDVSENEYIVFKTNSKKEITVPEAYEIKVEGLGLNMSITADPDASLQLFLPYRMGTIRANGQGKINMSVNKFGNFEIRGDYFINKGDFMFTLQNMFSRHLVINQGSKISWSGSPYDAEVNISATYRVKTSLGEFSPEATYAKSVPVNCIIQLKEKLFDPQIYFRVEFPSLDDQARQNVYARLDTTNQVLMSQQVISLLVANSFIQSTGETGNVNLNSFSIISNQLNNWLSRISKDFDIGVNYLPGDEMSDQQFELAISTQLLNNRVIIDGNLGMTGGENTNNTSNIVGEVNVELLISEDGKLRAKAFNKSNNDYLLKGYAPYTQGAGFSYRHDFNRLSEIFFSRKKARKTAELKVEEKTSSNE